MKKVRRRVVEREAQDQNEDQIDNQANHLYAFETNRAQKSSINAQDQQSKQQERVPQRITYGKRSQILAPEFENNKYAFEILPNLKHQTKEETSISPVSQIKSAKQESSSLLSHQTESNKQPEVKGSQDQRKNRIEMLKQKYLKKTPEIKIQKSKPVQEKNPILIQNIRSIPKQQKQLNIPQKVESSVGSTIKYEPKVVEEPIKAKEIHDIHDVGRQVQQAKQILNKQPQKKQPQQTVNSLPQKNEQKRSFKPPPPPVNRSNTNKAKPPPPPVARSYANQEQEVFVKENIHEDKTDDPVPIPFDNAEKQKDTPVRPNFVPPPPVKSNKGAAKSTPVQDILSKKVKKIEQKVKNSDEFKDKHQEQGHFAFSQEENLSSRDVETQKQHKRTPYQDNNIQKLQNKHIPHKKPQMSVSEEVNAWINAPLTVLSSIVPNIDNIISSLSDSSDQNFNFTSKNASFNSAVSGFINEFVLKNKTGLSEGQKTASYALSLQYFNSKDEPFSIQLLVILIKLGEPYLAKHASQILQHCQHHLSSILTNKHFFVSSELQAFTNIILNQKQIDQSEIIFMLLISTNQKLINYLSAKSFNNISYIISLLSCLQLVRKQSPNVINFYLKLINSLLQNIPHDQGLIQVILSHVNELQNNEKSYQLHKQTKLKLIKLISGSQNVTKPEVKMISPEPAAKQSGDGGLLGYWNKAVDKIKTATTQLAELKQEKAKPAQQEEQEEQITYDPVLKRYLINGKVPEDDSARPADPTASKLPPPPPPPKTANRPVPPPLPGKKARVATNRYA